MNSTTLTLTTKIFELCNLSAYQWAAKRDYHKNSRETRGLIGTTQPGNTLDSGSDIPNLAPCDMGVHLLFRTAFIKRLTWSPCACSCVRIRVRIRDHASEHKKSYCLIPNLMLLFRSRSAQHSKPRTASWDRPPSIPCLARCLNSAWSGSWDIWPILPFLLRKHNRERTEPHRPVSSWWDGHLQHAAHKDKQNETRGKASCE